MKNKSETKHNSYKHKESKNQKKAKKLLKSKLKVQKKAPRISFPYKLFLYRQELRRSNVDYSYLRLTRAKIMLTDDLISKNMRNFKVCSVEELKNLSREVQFKKRLTTQVQRLEQFHSLGLKNVVLNVVYTICLSLASAGPQTISVNGSNNDDLQKATNIVGETTLSVDLNFKPSTEPNTTKTTTAKPEAHDLALPKSNTIEDPKESAKDVAKITNVFEDNDYAYLSDRMPDSPEDEYLDLGEDSTPLHFLKRTSEKHEGQMNRKPVTPIYITIPIYINTAEKLPLALTIGGHEVPLNGQQMTENASTRKQLPAMQLQQTTPTKAPNSHFNRLLNHVETPKRRTTNRHRSSVRSKIYARKDRNSPVIYKQLEFYKPRGRSGSRTFGKYY